MENKKGSGVFLGVVGVATLIVAIIGATFAYFTATANSADNAIDVTAYEFNAGVSVSAIENPTGGIIPFDADGIATGEITNLTYALTTADPKCQDSEGYHVCTLYEVTVTNGAASQVVLTGNVETIVNAEGTVPSARAYTDGELKAAIVTKPSTDYVVGTTFDLKGTVGQNTALPGGNITVPGKVGETVGTTTLYIVVWLDEPAVETDQSALMGANYQARINLQASTGQRLTGTFTIA